VSSLEEAVLSVVGSGSVFLRKFEEFHSIIDDLLCDDEEADVKGSRKAANCRCQVGHEDPRFSFFLPKFTTKTTITAAAAAFSSSSFSSSVSHRRYLYVIQAEIPNMASLFLPTYRLRAILICQLPLTMTSRARLHSPQPLRQCTRSTARSTLSRLPNRKSARHPPYSFHDATQNTMGISPKIDFVWNT